MLHGRDHWPEMGKHLSQERNKADYDDQEGNAFKERGPRKDQRCLCLFTHRERRGKARQHTPTEAREGDGAVVARGPALCPALPHTGLSWCTRVLVPAPTPCAHLRGRGPGTGAGTEVAAPLPRLWENGRHPRAGPAQHLPQELHEPPAPLLPDHDDTPLDFVISKPYETD